MHREVRASLFALGLLLSNIGIAHAAISKEQIQLLKDLIAANDIRAIQNLIEQNPDILTGETPLEQALADLAGSVATAEVGAVNLTVSDGPVEALQEAVNQAASIY